MSMLKKVSVLGVVVMALICGGQTIEAKDIVLRVLSVYTPDHSVGPLAEKINLEFEKAHPGVKIEFQSMPADDLRKVRRIDFESGNPPAVFQSWEDSANLDFIDADAWYDFSKDLEADPAWRDNFLSGALDIHRYGTDGIWGIPQASFVLGMYYNKEMFAQAGITEVPETMAELLAVTEKLGELKGITPWPLGLLDRWRAAHIFAAVFYKLNGCDAATAAAERTIQHDGPEVLNTYKELQRLAESGSFGAMFTGLSYADEVSLFNEEKSAIRFSGTWTLGEIDEAIADKVGFFPFPYYADKPEYKDDWFAGFAGSWGVAASEDTEMVAAAVEYVKMWSSPEGFKLFAEMAKNLPAGKADVDAELTGALFADVAGRLGSIQNQEVDFGTPERVHEVGVAVETNAQAVLAGAMSPEDAAEQLQETVDAQQ